MTLALIATIIGAVCVALMVITDKLMLSDCYNGKTNHAWFVSSVAGAGFGLALTAFVWILVSIFSEAITLLAIINLSIDLLIWNGVLILIAGASSAQMLFHYFNCFSEDANSTSVANWIAATPIFVFGATVFLVFVNNTFNTHVVEEASFTLNPIFVLGAILATYGLVSFESLTNNVVKNIGKYRKDLTLMIVFNVVAIILLQQILSYESGAENSTYIISLLPYYWIGFLAGVRALRTKDDRVNFINEWRNTIKYALPAILFVEIIGMLVFFFEYFGLSELDPTYVTIIFGAHVLLVYYMEIILTKLRNRMMKNNQTSIKLLYLLDVSISNLPNENTELKSRALKLFSISSVIVGISICSFFIL